jgi:hypothetical protein
VAPSTLLIRRRCRSFSKAETIVTEEEKLRRAQPDKPSVDPILIRA